MREEMCHVSLSLNKYPDKKRVFCRDYDALTLFSKLQKSRWCGGSDTLSKHVPYYGPPSGFCIIN